MDASTADQPTLVRRALWLAWFTIAWNVVEGLAAVGFGVADESIALLGFGLDAWVEVGSAVMVLWRLRGETGHGGLDRSRERRATLVIGVLLVVLALATAVGAIAQLVSGGHPTTTVPGVIIGGVSLSFMVYLWRAKRHVALELDSRTLLADAACSKSCVQLSAILLGGSLVYALAPALWWADAVAALGLAWIIAREGRENIEIARQPEFTGGCGCDHD